MLAFAAKKTTVTSLKTCKMAVSVPLNIHKQNAELVFNEVLGEPNSIVEYNIQCRN